MCFRPLKALPAGQWVLPFLRPYREGVRGCRQRRRRDVQAVDRDLWADSVRLQAQQQSPCPCLSACGGRDSCCQNQSERGVGAGGWKYSSRRSWQKKRGLRVQSWGVWKRGPGFNVDWPLLWLSHEKEILFISQSSCFFLTSPTPLCFTSWSFIVNWHTHTLNAETGDEVQREIAAAAASGQTKVWTSDSPRSIR